MTKWLKVYCPIHDKYLGNIREDTSAYCSLCDVFYSPIEIPCEEEKEHGIIETKED